MIGQTLGEYTIRSALGSGGMGKVYLAEDREGRKRALKVVHAHLLESPGYFKRFLREAEIGRKVDHENVVRTLDVDAITIDGTQFNFLVMEYVEGQTLRALLDDIGRAPEELCRHIGREIAKALDAIHAAGVVHRDLKPENVLITADHVVKLMDLGVAQLADAALRLSQTGVFLGSVLYAAPEQLTGAEADPRADLYSLGLVLHELATGQHPMRAENFAAVLRRRQESPPRPVAEINPQVSPFLEEVIATLLRADPAERFASARELGAVLEDGEDSAWWSDRAREIRERTRRPLRRVRIPRETSVYGRADELAHLERIFARVRAGEGQVVLIQGEAGIGKTRLVDEFAARLEDETNFLFGSYPPGGAATEAGAFSTAYREHFGDRDLTSYLEETPLLAPAFAALLRGEPPPRGEQPLTRDSLQTVFVQATRALARERPTILLVDDLHFAPAEGRALFAALAMAVPAHRILLVGTMRRGVSEDWIAGVERLPQASLLHLPRLGPKDLAKLLVDAFRSERLAQELSFKIATKSDGNPFFVFEIIRGMREGNLIRQREDGSWVTTQVIREIEVPSSVADLVQARISSLGDEEREVLDVASCCGFEFDGTLVAAALGAERIPTLRRLARIEKRHHLVHATGRTFLFDHHQVQESLYGALPESLREEYHAALGDALEKREPRASDAVALCEHFLRGGRAERAKPHLKAALRHLDEGYLFEAGLDLVHRMLAVPDLLVGPERLDPLVWKAKRLGILGRRDEERAVLDEAVALADRGGDPEAKAEARMALAAHLGNISQYGKAEKATRELLGLAREAGSRRLEALGHEYLAIITAGVGRYDEAQEHFDTAYALHREELDDARGLINLLGTQGGVLAARGRYEEARALHEEALALARKAGDREGQGIETGNLGNICFHLGLFAEALEHYDRCHAIFVQIGARRPTANALSALADLWIQLGDAPRARELSERCLALAAEIEYGVLQAVAPLTQAHAAGLEGRQEDARRLFETGLERARAIPLPSLVGSALNAMAEVAGFPEETRPLLEEAQAIGREKGLPGTLCVAAASLALLPGGDAKGAVAAFEEHAAHLGPLETMRIRFLLWKATGDGTHLAEAQRLLRHFRDHAPADHRESMVENVPVHRAIAAAAGGL